MTVIGPSSEKFAKDLPKQALFSRPSDTKNIISIQFTFGPRFTEVWRKFIKAVTQIP